MAAKRKSDTGPWRANHEPHKPLSACQLWGEGLVPGRSGAPLTHSLAGLSPKPPLDLVVDQRLLQLPCDAGYGIHAARSEFGALHMLEHAPSPAQARLSAGSRGRMIRSWCAVVLCSRSYWCVWTISSC